MQHLVSRMIRPHQPRATRPAAGFWRQYSPILGAIDLMPIRQIDFQQFLAGDMPIKSMLHEFEAALLYALAKDYWTGNGAILDLGPYYGLSTFALAAGVAANERVTGKAGRIHSYDLFLRHGYEWFANTPLAERTGSVFPDWLHLNAAHLDLIVPCPGDATLLDWTGGQIEILFIDLAKSWDLNQWVISKTFPNLIPGRSVVVQQDWVHFAEYWVHVAMARFHDRFEFIEAVYGSSVAFLCVKPIGADEAAEDLSALPISEKLRLLDVAATWMPLAVREPMKVARAKCLFDHGETAAARRALGDVNVAKLADDSASDFSGIAASDKAALLAMIDAT